MKKAAIIVFAVVVYVDSYAQKTCFHCCRMSMMRMMGDVESSSMIMWWQMNWIRLNNVRFALTDVYIFDVSD